MVSGTVWQVGECKNEPTVQTREFIGGTFHTPTITHDNDKLLLSILVLDFCWEIHSSLHFQKRI